MLLSKTLQAGIIGASGYTGVELVRLLLGHPYVHIKALVADSNANRPIADIYSHLRTAALPPLVTLADADINRCDVVFCCLPHTTSQEVIKNLPAHVRVIDLSADFRLEDPDVYEQWYGHTHQAPELQKTAVYGLSEFYAEEISASNLVACPGCYPTSMLLPLAPLCKVGIIYPDDIIVDSKSGVTGAGRSAKVPNLFCEINDNFKAYGISNHRHTPEVEQVLSQHYGKQVTINFTPHLVPMNRGILSTIYINLKNGSTLTDVRNVLAQYYEHKPFVTILPEGQLPSTRDVTGSNHCHIGLAPGRSPGKVVLVSVIDNLIKGASGQAVQNMNIMFGFKEPTGLHHLPLFP